MSSDWPVADPVFGRDKLQPSVATGCLTSGRFLARYNNAVTLNATVPLRLYLLDGMDLTVAARSPGGTIIRSGFHGTPDEDDGDW
jgi:hypothetical protein